MATHETPAARVCQHYSQALWGFATAAARTRLRGGVAQVGSALEQVGGRGVVLRHAVASLR